MDFLIYFALQNKVESGFLQTYTCKKGIMSPFHQDICRISCTQISKKFACASFHHFHPTNKLAKY